VVGRPGNGDGFRAGAGGGQGDGAPKPQTPKLEVRHTPHASPWDVRTATTMNTSFDKSVDSGYNMFYKMQ